MRTFVANDPLPYRPIRIVDISPYRSSVRRRPVTPGNPRKVRRIAAALLGSAFAVGVLAATVGAAPAGVQGEFRLAPGHAMPVAIGDTVEAKVVDRRNPGREFRLGPGHAMPAFLVR